MVRGRCVGRARVGWLRDGLPLHGGHARPLLAPPAQSLPPQSTIYAHCPLYKVFLEAGKPFQAVQSAEEAVALAPTWADAHLSLARAQLAMGQVDLGQASMRAALALDPDHKEARQEYEELQRYLLTGEAFDGGTQMEGD